VGPIIAWRRVTAANLRRNFLFPVTAGLLTLVVLIAVGGVATRPFALALFALATFVIASVAQELWRGVAARRAMTGDAVPVALVALIRRNRRRYGGYIVHAGLAVLLIGVAASSSFQHSSDVILKPGQSHKVDGYTITYVRPLASATPAKLSFGAVLNVNKNGKHVTTLRTTRGFYPAQDVSLGVLGRFFNGSSDSQVGLRAGLTKDIWTVINPDLTPLQRQINQGDRLFAKLIRQEMSAFVARHYTTAQAQQALAPLWRERDQAIAGLAARFVSHPWPVNFLLIVSPLVTWIWLGALIIAIGGLIALSPVPALARRRATSSYPARPAPSVPARELA
jgi:cytochrome c-type biogenesis protein CcmF